MTLSTADCCFLFSTSNLYTLQHGCLQMSELIGFLNKQKGHRIDSYDAPSTDPNRMFGSTPVIKLGDQFKKVAIYQKRFKSIPSLLELDHLTVSGDVTFGRNVQLRGTVIVVAMEGSRIDIADGSILENSESLFLPL